jgi:hypothetical protein
MSQEAEDQMLTSELLQKIHAKDQLLIDGMYAEIGRVFVWWGHIEYGLQAIFHLTLGSGDWDSKAALFHMSSTFARKLEMTDTVLGVFFEANSEVKDEWSRRNGLRDRLKGCAEERNMLAHFGVSVMSAGLGEGKKVAYMRDIAAGKRKRSKRLLHLSDIVSMRSRFEQLWRDLGGYELRIEDKLGRNWTE